MYFDNLRHYKELSPKEAYLMEPRITVSDKQRYCEQKGFAQLHYWPNLTSPETYNEKLLWLALHYTVRIPWWLSAQIEWDMKKYVADTVGPAICCACLWRLYRPE